MTPREAIKFAEEYLNLGRTPPNIAVAQLMWLRALTYVLAALVDTQPGASMASLDKEP